jgi:hypothetical protein
MFRWIRSLIWIVVFKVILDILVTYREPDGWMLLALAAFWMAVVRVVIFTIQGLNSWSRQ